MEIYLDVLFFMNFSNNLWILWLLKRRFELDGSTLRLWIGAVIGASLYVGQFAMISVFGSSLNSFWDLVPYGGIWLGILLPCLVTILSTAIMTRLLLTERKRHLWKKVLLFGFLYSFVIAGILRVIFVQTRLFTGQEVTAASVMLGVFVCAGIGSFLIKKGKEVHKKCLCKAVIISSGERTGVQALIDTGNSLLEPLSGKPVCLMEEELLARITLENPLFYRAIPFRSVGCDKGILYGVELPELTIYKDEQCYRATQVICAGVPYKLSKKGEYRMILHPKLCEEYYLCK